MLLWLLLRAVYLAWHEIESRTRPASTQLADIEAIHLILTHGISFLLMWHISAQANLSALTSVSLWAMWWTHAISSAKNLAMQLRRSVINQPINKRSPAAQRILKVIFIGMSIFAAGIVLVERIAVVVKGNGYTIFAEHMQLRFIPALQRDFWIGLMAGGLVLLSTRQLVVFKVVAHHILLWFPPIGEKAQGVQQRTFSDPLDFYDQAKHIFQKTAEFIYQRFEKESTEKIGEGLSGVFKFLFRTVEGFTSGNLWNRALAAILKSSRNLQQMHHGILRFNIVLLLVFIIGVSIFAWVWYMNGWV